MVKRCFRSGYTLAEMIMVLLVISVLILLSVPVLRHGVSPSLVGSYIKLRILSAQQSAILTGEAQPLSFQDMAREAGLEDWKVITADAFHINKRGNINRGGKVSLKDETDHGLTITIWIGFGRILCEW